MGNWGYGVLDSDSAMDVYGTYMDLYNVGGETGEIRRQIEQQYGDRAGLYGDGAAGGTDYWLALAHAQWECKALDADVRTNVEQIVELDVEQDDWDPPDYPKRRTALKRFLSRIRKPKAKPKKRTPPKFFDAPFQKGDCLVFRRPNGYYGGALVLWASEQPERIGANIVALLRLNQRKKLTIADFRSSHLLVKSWGDADGRSAIFAEQPEPAISAIGVSNLDELKEARRLDVAGNLAVGRTFGQVVYGFHTSWCWEMTLKYQFEWEKKNRKLEADLSFPVREVIQPVKGEWGVLGELLAATQQGVSDFNEYRRHCRAFRKQMRKMKLEPNTREPNTRLLEFVSRYLAASIPRATNRIEDVLENAK